MTIALICRVLIIVIPMVLELKILSWNIYMLLYIGLFNNNNQRAEAIADKLQGSDYQIIVFQEAFSSKCRRTLSRKLLANCPFQYGPTNKANGKRRIFDYALVRNGDLVHKMERKVQTFFAHIGEYESHLSDHYALEFSINFTDNTKQNVRIF